MSYTRFVAYSVVPLLLIAVGLLDPSIIVTSIIGGIAELFVIARMLDRRKATKLNSSATNVSDTALPPELTPEPGCHEAATATLSPDAKNEVEPPFVSPYDDPLLDATTFRLNQASTTARPWPRYWARSLDILLFSALLALIVGWIWARAFPASYVDLLGSEGFGRYLFGWALSPLAMVLDAAIYSTLGNTPGKALLGLKVTRLDGSQLKFGAALRRNFGVYVAGLGMGIPIVVLFTCFSAYKDVKANKPSSWDIGIGSRVNGQAKGYRSWLGALSYFALLVALQSMNSTERPVRRTVTPSGTVSRMASSDELLAEARRKLNEQAAIQGPGEVATIPQSQPWSIERQLDDARLKADAADAVSVINAASPRMTDDSTRLDGAEVGPGAGVTLFYTLVNIDSALVSANRKSYAVKMQANQMHSEYCGDGPLKPLRATGLAVHFAFRDRKSRLFMNLAVHPSDCP